MVFLLELSTITTPDKMIVYISLQNVEGPPFPHNKVFITTPDKW
jgi:hypothetical protein